MAQEQTETAPKPEVFQGSLYVIHFVLSDYGYSRVLRAAEEAIVHGAANLEYNRIFAGTFIASYRLDVDYPPISKIWDTKELKARGKKPLNEGYPFHLNNGALFRGYDQQKTEFMFQQQLVPINPSLKVTSKNTGGYWKVRADDSTHFSFEVKGKTDGEWRDARVSFVGDQDTFEMVEAVNAEVDVYYAALRHADK